MIFKTIIKRGRGEIRIDAILQGNPHKYEPAEYYKKIKIQNNQHNNETSVSPGVDTSDF